MMPGATTVTPMPRGPSSRASECCNGVQIGEIDRYEAHVARLAELLRHVAAALFKNVRKDQTRAGRGTGARDRPPDAACGACHDDGAPGEHSLDSHRRAYRGHRLGRQLVLDLLRQHAPHARYADVVLVEHLA